MQNICSPRNYEPQISEFDRLRKRVAYLSKGKRSLLTRDGDANEGVPDNMRLYQGFLEEDERKKRAIREAGVVAAKSPTGIESDSDESIREIKRKHKRKESKIDLNTLSDAEIAKLTMHQIEALQTEPPCYSNLPEEQHEEVLNTRWLLPQQFLRKGQWFGEQALTQEDYACEGTAICTKACKVKSLTIGEYQCLRQKMDSNKTTAKNNFLKKLPMFAHWPTKWLNKFQLEEENFIRNQVVYSEGDAP